MNRHDGDSFCLSRVTNIILTIHFDSLLISRQWVKFGYESMERELSSDNSAGCTWKMLCVDFINPGLDLAFQLGSVSVLCLVLSFLSYDIKLLD